MVAAAALLMVAPYLAAQEAAESEIQVIKTDNVQITGLEDWLIASTGPDAVTTTSFRSVIDNICVHSSTGRYSLAVSSVNGGPQFNLISTSGDTLRYRIITWSLDGNGTPSDTLERRVLFGPATLTDRLASPTVSCVGQGFSGDRNVRMRALVLRGDFNSADPGIYQDTVILMVSPE